MEELARAQKRELGDMNLDEKNELWEQAKQEEAGKAPGQSAADAPLAKQSQAE